MRPDTLNCLTFTAPIARTSRRETYRGIIMEKYVLQVKDYQYPGESGAFDALRKVPFLDKAVLTMQKAGDRRYMPGYL